MDHLWTPWRFDYISKAGHPENGCVFCQVRSEDRDEANYVLYRGAHCFLILNLFPYTSGHILIVANRHIASLSEASVETLQETIQLARRSEAALRAEYKPDGYNMGFNVGRAAGAGVAHHLHMHVLPRWTGDSNFVSVLGETRIVPEDLAKTYRRLHPYFGQASLDEDHVQPEFRT
jgi:ATP adenylyltransferase